jgi:hypothetical protein
MPKVSRLDLINVFFYRYWDAQQMKLVTSTRAATYDTIKRRGWQPIPESRQTVPRLLIDPEGFLADRDSHVRGNDVRASS